MYLKKKCEIRFRCYSFLLFNILFLLLWPFILPGQTIPEDRLSDWSTAGLTNADIPVLQSVNFLEQGGIGNGLTLNDGIFEEILFGLPEGMTEIYFPEGTYRFSQSLVLPGNIVLKGDGAGLTKLLFGLNGVDHLIRVEGTGGTQLSILEADVFRGEESIQLVDALSFSVGDFIQFVDVDTMLITSDWAIGATGQLNRVSGKNGNTLLFENPLRRNFLVNNQSFILKYNPIQNVGIENLSIEREDSTAAQTSNILFRYASNCWVKCVESYQCNFAHIDIRYGSNIAVTGSYFKEAFNYGNGGKAYGVMAHFASGDNLIYDNIFERLRHAMILQAGANGNVFAYNYSVDPFWTDVNLPSSSAGDLVLHGNYPYSNLFEGNICQNIVIDDSHGINGMYNTFFRNRAEKYGVFMNFVEPTDRQNFIANEISNTDSLGFYFLFGLDHYEQANNLKGIMMPVDTEIPTESSLFLDGIPEFFQNDNWPPIGYPNELNAFSIGAKDRFMDGVFTSCMEVPSTSRIDKIEETTELSIYPNPVVDELFINELSPGNLTSLRIYSLSGKLSLNIKDQPKIDVRKLQNGMYILVIELNDGSFRYLRFVKVSH